MPEPYTGDPEYQRLADDAMREEGSEEPAVPRPRIYTALRPVNECVWYLDNTELCRMQGDGSLVIPKHKFSPRQARALLSALLTHWLTTENEGDGIALADVLHQIDVSL